jgi:thioredoxin
LSMCRIVTVLWVAATLAAGPAAAAASEDYPYDRARNEAVQATIELQSRHESVRLHGLEILEQMLSELGVSSVAAMDAAEGVLSPSQFRAIRESHGSGGPDPFSVLRMLLAERLDLAGASKAAILKIDLGAEPADSVMNAGKDHWYRVDLPRAGQLSMQSQECPATWAAYRQSTSSGGLERLPDTRAANISEMFFPAAGQYLIRVDPLTDCNGIRYSSNWRPDVIYVGVPQKNAPLLMTGSSTNTVTLGAGQSAWFKVIVNGRQHLAVETSRQRPGVDTVLELYSPGGAIPLQSDDDGGEEQGGSSLDLIAVESGEYLIRAGELHAGPASFDIVFKATEIRAAGLGVFDSPATGEGEKVLLSFSAKAGHRYRFVTQDLGNDVDTYVTVYRRGESEALVENDDVEEGILSSYVEWDVGSDGEYLITIDGGSGESGQFRYRLSEEPVPIGQCETPDINEKRMVTAASFEADVEGPSNGNLVVVEFWAEWCGWCRQFEPILRSVVAESCRSVQLVSVDVEREADVATRFGVEAVPTVVLYAKGAEVARFNGIRSRTQLRALLRKELSRAGLRAST